MTADEVLSTMEYEEEDIQEVCVIDAETRTISVPACYSVLGVESDEKTKRVYFSCPAVVDDNIDLLNYSLRIIYRNANGETGLPYLINDAVLNGDNIEFSWELSRKVTAYKGKVSFIFCAVNADPESGQVMNEWNTTLATSNVLEGLEPDQSEIEESREDIIMQMLAVMRDYIQQAITETLDGYEGNDGATFTPAVSEDGELSWTNDKGLNNPEPVNIKGPAGKTAYEYAVEGGYEDTEEEFKAKLAAEIVTVTYDETTQTLNICSGGGDK